MAYGFADKDFYANPAHEGAPALRCRAPAAAIVAAAEMLGGAKRPILLAGGGVHLAGASEALSNFASALNMPVAHTLTGKGAIACTDPLSAGLFGRYDRIADPLIDASDVILVVGCKLGEIATKRYTVPASGKRIIHLDVLPEEFGRTVEPSLILWSDALLGIEDLQAALAPRAAEIKERQTGYAADVGVRMAKWREEVTPRLTSSEKPVNMVRLMTEINVHLPADGLLLADGGFAAHWGGLLFDSKRPGRSFIPDRGFASIGYGLPGAMGAALAASGRPIVSLTGDGGFNVMLGELETARRMKLKFTIVVVNNAASGYVKALQHLVYGPGAYHASDLSETNYAKVAEVLGCRGIRVEDPSDLGTALKASLANDGPTIVDVVMTRDPSQMLPGVDNRAASYKKGDRVA